MTTLNEMTSAYNRTAYTHLYIFGYVVKGVVYYTYATAEVLNAVLKLDTASRGAGASLRYRPNAEQKALLFALNHTALCTKAELEAEAASSIYNRGEIFEKLVTEMFGQVWTKDNVPYTEAGDVEVNGVAYQVKYEKATFLTEKQYTAIAA